MPATGPDRDRLNALRGGNDGLARGLLDLLELALFVKAGGGVVTDRPALLGERTELTVHTLGDWHVGAGHGIPGGADAVVRRDEGGLPYVPGTTLTGLLRDACLTVAVALDDGADGGGVAALAPGGLR